ncbi:MAG TPA: glycoside hydrolase family 130 protein [Candidatus Limnocylindria bacterium]|nr:glycoside hydrolase family 130 protein [Candidatus Limnocylindria bacterium]
MASIIGSPLPSIPWEDRPSGNHNPVWRYSGNPIIPRDAIPGSNSIFNSAAVPFGDGYAGVFRCDSKALQMDIFPGFSDDGIHWRIGHEPIRFQGEPEVTRFEYRYDARVCMLEGKYYITWCNGYHGPTIGVGWTEDFQTFHQLENAFLPFNRNGVLFPRKVNGEYLMLSRPSDNGHTPFGDIFLSRSPDLVHWGKHRFVFGTAGGWQSTKVGAGPVPIETDEGWLLIYHGVITTCNGYVYRFGAALLDLDQPWKVITRGSWYLMGPETLYELAGDVPGVAFPCAALTDAPTGRIAMYYGCADTVTGLCFTTVDEVLSYIRAHPMAQA